MNTRINGEQYEHYISQAQAARMRAVTRQAIADLIKRGRLNGIRLAGRTLLLRSEVEDFRKLARGRPYSNAPKRRLLETIPLAQREIRHEHTQAY